MLYSMTGFGRCLAENPVCRQQWEIRSVNGKYLDLKWKLPRLVRSFEYRLEKIARRHASRGRLEINLELQLGEQYCPKAAFDHMTAASMLSELREFCKNNSLSQTPDSSLFLLCKDLWGEPEIRANDLLFHHLEEGLVMCLEDWNQSRQSEGMALGEDLFERVRKMEAWLSQLMKHVPEIRAARLEAFRQRVGDLLGGEITDEARLQQEIAMLSDRLDVTEELTRLSVHLARLVELLENAAADTGRRLDFTLQECFREINTCGNKLPDADLSRIIVDFKNELEKCREQAMNLE